VLILIDPFLEEKNSSLPKTNTKQFYWCKRAKTLFSGGVLPGKGKKQPSRDMCAITAVTKFERIAKGYSPTGAGLLHSHDRNMNTRLKTGPKSAAKDCALKNGRDD
jgi:hypothetical protein